MKTTTIQLTIALFAGVASAQEPQAPNNHRPPPQGPPPIFSIFDTDRDGVLSSREIRKASDALASLDRNGDRQITREEFMPPPPPEGGNGPKPEGRRRPMPVIAALDTDKNGTLSAEELKAAPDSLLELDANGDGALTPDELHPHGPPPPPEGGAPQQPE